jgi:hypothetical protein
VCCVILQHEKKLFLLIFLKSIIIFSKDPYSMEFIFSSKSSIFNFSKSWYCFPWVGASQNKNVQRMLSGCFEKFNDNAFSKPPATSSAASPPPSAS